MKINRKFKTNICIYGYINNFYSTNYIIALVNCDLCKIMASFRTNYSLNFISYTDQPIGLQFFFKHA